MRPTHSCVVVPVDVGDGLVGAPEPAGRDQVGVAGHHEVAGEDVMDDGREGLLGVGGAGAAGPATTAVAAIRDAVMRAARLALRSCRHCDAQPLSSVRRPDRAYPT